MTVNLARLREYPIVAPDCETTGLHWYRDQAFGIAIGVHDGKRAHSAYYDLRTNPGALEALRRELPHCKRVINHNMKFDSHFMLNHGIGVPMDRIECTSVRAALINEHEPSFSLDALGAKYVNMRKVDVWEDLAKMFGGQATKAVQIKNLHRAPEKVAGKYAAQDPMIAIALWLWQEEQIKAQQLERVWGLERALMPVLIDIERQGVRVDEELAHRQLIVLDGVVKKAQIALNRMVGQEVNVNSPPQMRVMLGVENRGTKDKPEFYTSGGIKLPHTATGNPSIGKEQLMLLAAQGDERAKNVLTVRKMLKAQQFLKDHIIGHVLNGRVFPNYNQTRGDNELGTGTGRFSIDDPALQQIPARDKDVAAIVRSCFLPEVGHKWGCADWEQFEFRWFAHYTGDPNILAVYKDDPNADYHGIVSKITGIPRNPRFAGDANAKQINLGLVFGMGPGKMAATMGMPYTMRAGNGNEWMVPGDEAKEVFNRYHGAIPGVKQLLDQASSIARSRGYVHTVMGRHLRFPGGKFTHKAAGLVFQGTSADCMKQKMVELHPICKKEGWPMLLSVHDELDFSVPAKQVKKATPILKSALETFDGKACPIECRVPIRSSVVFADNWWEASK